VPGSDAVGKEAGDRRPSRAEVRPAALELIQRYGASIMMSARRYAASPEDAEDAYQRGVEILLTKAPSTSEDDLLPWLKTVVKHEAFALRRQRDRVRLTGEEAIEQVAERAAPAHEQAEQYERLSLGAEALGRLKPQEVRCLLLKAEGYSYRQICDITGWTYTKVNRCLTEGRQSFLDRVNGIESGAECDRLSPLLSALADGEATAADLQALRPHMRSCLRCRAELKEHRSTPARVAGLIPPVALVGPDPGALERGWGTIAAWMHERGAEVALRLHAPIEIGSAQKVAAVAASTAVIAGGGAATMRSLESERAVEPRARVAAVEKRDRPRKTADTVPPGDTTSQAPAPVQRAPSRIARGGPPAKRERPRSPQPPRQPPRGEFDPAPATAVSAGGAYPASEPTRSYSSPGGGSGGGGSGGAAPPSGDGPAGGEFAP